MRVLSFITGFIAATALGIAAAAPTSPRPPRRGRRIGYARDASGAIFELRAPEEVKGRVELLCCTGWESARSEYTLADAFADLQEAEDRAACVSGEGEAAEARKRVALAIETYTRMLNAAVDRIKRARETT